MRDVERLEYEKGECIDASPAKHAYMQGYIDAYRANENVGYSETDYGWYEALPPEEVQKWINDRIAEYSHKVHKVIFSIQKGGADTTPCKLHRARKSLGLAIIRKMSPKKKRETK